MTFGIARGSRTPLGMKVAPNSVQSATYRIDTLIKRKVIAEKSFNGQLFE